MGSNRITRAAREAEVSSGEVPNTGQNKDKEHHIVQMRLNMLTTSQATRLLAIL